MSNTYLIVILFVCAIAVVVLQFTPQISTATKRKFIDKLWFKLTVAILIAIVALCANLIKEHNSDVEHDLKEKALVKYYSNRNDSINMSNTLSFIDELAKYGLHYDLSEKRIEMLVKDSMNKEIPDFGLRDTKKSIYLQYNSKGDSIYGHIEFDDKGNCPVVFALDIYIIPCINEEFQRPRRLNSFRNKIVNIGEFYTYDFDLLTDPNKRFTHLYIFLRGRYSNLDNRISYPINWVFKYSLVDSKWGDPLIFEETDVRNFLKSNGIK